MGARSSSDVIVDEYLDRLRRALRSVGSATRDDFIAEIAQHIAEGRANLHSDDDGALRAMLDRLGSPTILAHEVRETAALVPIRTVDKATPWFLALGGYVSGIGWLFGLYGVWTSKVWRATDKILGSLIFPGFLAIYFYSKGASDSALCVRRGAPEYCQGSSYLPIVITSLALLVGVFFRLLWVLYRRQAMNNDDRADFVKISPINLEAPTEERAILWRRLSLLALGFVLTLAVAGLVAAYHYQPILQSYDGQYSTRVVAANGTAVTVTTVPLSSAFTTESSGFRPNVLEADAVGNEMVVKEPRGIFTVELTTTINNTGSHAVTIDQIHAPTPDTSDRVLRVEVFRYANGSSKNESPFRPFTLRGHESKTVVIAYPQRCVPHATNATAPVTVAVPVTYTFFHFRHTVMVPVWPYAITGRASC